MPEYRIPRSPRTWPMLCIDCSEPIEAAEAVQWVNTDGRWETRCIVCACRKRPELAAHFGRSSYA